jgi:hypothetical protein
VADVELRADAGWAVVLIVLGEHLLRLEGAIRQHAAECDHPCPLAKEIGQHAAVDDGNLLFEIRYGEVHFHAAGGARDTAFLDESAQAELLPGPEVSLGDLARNEIESDVLAEGAERERSRHADSRQNAEHQHQPAPSWGHV